MASSENERPQDDSADRRRAASNWKIEPPRKALLQGLTQLASKHGLQDAAGKEDGKLRFDKTAIGINTACGHKTVGVRMNTQVPSPRVQRRDDASFGSQILFIGEQSFERLPRGRHQFFGEEFTIESPEIIQFFRDSEDDVHVSAGKKLLRCFFQPVRSTSPAALRTGPVTTGVVFHMSDVATVTAFDMRAKLRSPTVYNRGRSTLHICP